jgi:hypothetical protein
VVALDDLRARSVTTFDRIGESVVDARVDLELTDSPRCEPALDRGDERPDQALPPVRGIDQHVEEARAGFGPSGACDRKSDEDGAVPRGHHHRFAIGGLPPHLA